MNLLSDAACADMCMFVFVYICVCVCVCVFTFDSQAVFLGARCARVTACVRGVCVYVCVESYAIFGDQKIILCRMCVRARVALVRCFFCPRACTQVLGGWHHVHVKQMPSAGLDPLTYT